MPGVWQRIRESTTSCSAISVYTCFNEHSGGMGHTLVVTCGLAADVKVYCTGRLAAACMALAMCQPSAKVRPNEVCAARDPLLQDRGFGSPCWTDVGLLLLW